MVATVTLLLWPGSLAFGQVAGQSGQSFRPPPATLSGAAADELPAYAQTPEQKRLEAKRGCRIHQAPTGNLAATGILVTDRQDRWPFFLLVFAVGVTLAYAVVVLRRRRRASRGEQVEARKGPVETVSGVVALCAALSVFATQFFPGIGVQHHPAPAATMAVRQVDGRITRGAFTRGIGANAPTSRFDRLEIGDVAYVEVHLTGYRGRRLRLRWGLSEARRDGAQLPSTDQATELVVPHRADSINFFLPVWISLPKTSFEIRFYLSDRSNALLQLATSAPLRGSHYRYECVRD